MADGGNSPDAESSPNARGKLDLKSLRVSQDLEPATKPAFGHVYLGKPGRLTFFRSFLIPERSERYSVVEDAEKGLYLVTPKLAFELSSDTYPVCLVPFVTRDPSVGLWPIKTGRPGAKPNPWNESAYKIALVAKEKWIRLLSNQALGCYEAKAAIGDFEDPIFPEDKYDELIGRAFDGRIIENSGHFIIQKLLGAL